MADLVTPVRVLARCYHTVNNTDPHVEGDEYEITDVDVLRNVVVCGFADVTPSTPFVPELA